MKSERTQQILDLLTRAADRLDQGPGNEDLVVPIRKLVGRINEEVGQ